MKGHDLLADCWLQCLIIHQHLPQPQCHNLRHIRIAMDTEPKKRVDLMFDRTILAVNPRQTFEIHPPTACVMDRLQTCDVSATNRSLQNCDLYRPISTTLRDKPSKLRKYLIYKQYITF